MNRIWKYLGVTQHMFITNLNEQMYKGDYKYIDPFWGNIEYIEEKENKGLFMMVETWSYRNYNSKGWIYKQLQTKYLVQHTKHHLYLIDYQKLRDIWFKLYPDPSKLTKKQEYPYRNYIDMNMGFHSSHTNETNESEGYYIPEQWWIDNKLIINKW